MKPHGQDTPARQARSSSTPTGPIEYVMGTVLLLGTLPGIAVGADIGQDCDSSDCTNISAAVNASASSGMPAYGLYATSQDQTITSLSGSVTSTNSRNTYSSASAYGIAVFYKALAIDSLSGAVTATATNTRDGTYAITYAAGIYSAGRLTIQSLSESGSVTAESDATATNADATSYANGIIVSSFYTTEIGSLAGSVTATSNATASHGSATAYANGIILSVRGLTIDSLSGTVTAISSASSDSTSRSVAYGIRASYSSAPSVASLTISDLSGTVSATAEDRAIGISATGATDLTISGSVAATATAGEAYGLLSGGAMNLALSGTVSAEAHDLAVGISATGAMDLVISGNVEATATAGEAYAIHSGSGDASSWTDAAVADSLTLLDGASLTGQIDLGGGDDSLTIQGGVTLDGDTTLGAGADTLTLDGATIDLSGTLSGGDDTDTIVLTGSDDATLAVSLSDFETLAKSGSSSWTLASNLDLGSSGSATVADGTLSVTGTLSAGAVTIGVDGTLAGTGTITGDVTNSGTVSPGNSSGTLSIDGNYVQTDSGTLVIEDGDLLKISGSASLAGSLILDIGAYYSSGTYTFLEADGGISSTFSSVSNSTFLTLYLDYDTNSVSYTDDVTYTITRAAYTGVADNRNAYAAAAALSTIAAANPSRADLQSVIGTVDFLPTSQAATLMNQLHPEPYDSLLQNGFGTLRLFARAGVRTSQLPCAQETTGSDTPPDPWNRECAEERQAWLIPLLSRSHWDSSAGVAGYDATTSGFAVGMNLPDLGALRWQAQLGYAHSNFDYDSSALDAEADTWLAGLFAQLNAGPRYLRASLQTGWSETRMKRRLDLGTSTRVAEGTPEQFLCAAGVSAGQTFVLSPTVQIAPEASLDYAFVHDDAFSESGASSLDLLVDGDQAHSLRSTLGVRVHFAAPTMRGFDQYGELGLGWIHEFANNSRLLDAAFRGAPEYTFTARTEARPDDALGLSLSWQYPLARNAALAFDYQGELAHDDQQHVFSVRLNVPF